MRVLVQLAKMKPTTELIVQLRELMQNTKFVPEPIHAYIVPSGDAHFGEYTAPRDQRRGYISGFKGSAGTAIITLTSALMWTDGRYFTQAVQEMDSNWVLMKEGQPDTLSTEMWLSRNLPPNSTVGVDPKNISYNKWLPLQTQLKLSGHKLVACPNNLIDLVWPDQPPRSKNPVKPLPINFSGKSASEKLDAIRKDMKTKNASLLVISALDEIAWTLNLRGSDISYNPVFFSYLLIFPNSVTLYINEKQVTSEVEAHLNDEIGKSNYKIEPYEKIYEGLKSAVDNIEGLVWISETTNYSLVSLIPINSLLAEITPPALMKTVKNLVEIEGMRKAHIRDAVAVCSYFAWLEKHLTKSSDISGTITGTITEISGAKKLEQFRAEQKHFIGLSFDTISSVGPHAAIIHYKPDPSTDVPITTDAVYLCDSGGQYLDGTTDITRTMHFGTPTEHEKEFFTLVLKGVISVATSIFPSKLKGSFLDSFARKNLWNLGLDYGHGTGHGVGSYLNVHEGPIGVHHRYSADDPGLDSGMFISNEPGYYEEGKFGFRHEDIVQVVPASTPHNFNNRGFCTFETVSLVPVQRKMIAVEMLAKKEVEYLNDYHKKCREVVGPLLEEQGKMEAKEWLWKETEPIKVVVRC